MNEQEKLRKLEALATQDPAWQAWRRSYEASREEFQALADAQPEEVRNILYGYAEGGRLMYQRLVNLACTHMEFPAK